MAFAVHLLPLVFQLTAIDQRFLSNPIGKVSEEVLEEIFSALDTITGRV
jgi:mRNA-degrading endonuclease toxin of MazEF toxin-antitoxin module